MHAPIGMDVRETGDNSWGSHIRATFALGIPLIGSQLAQLGIHTTDVVIVGQLGAVNLAAMVLAGQFLFTVFIFGSGISIGVMPMVSSISSVGGWNVDARRSCAQSSPDSSTTTSTPAWASSVARTVPTGPAPTIATWHRSTPVISSGLQSNF